MLADPAAATSPSEGGVVPAVDAESDMCENEACLNTVSRPPTKVTYNWVDITADFAQACSQLGLGELVHDAT